MMTREESISAAERILTAAGWRPPPDGFVQGALVCGHPPPGAGADFVVKNLSKVPQCEATAMGFDPADCPDEPHEAAAWLVARFAVAPATDFSHETLSEPGQSDSHETHGGTGEAQGLHEGGEASENRADTEVGGLGRVPAEPDFPDDPPPDEPIDADFEAFEDPADDALDLGELDDYALDPLLLEGESDEANVTPPEPEPEYPGPIAYAASDLDALIREKMGRVSQIARELKARLQEGWTLEEYASLQNLIVRIERREADDDPVARERFDQISAYSRAMSRVDTHRDALEDALEAIGRERDYRAAEAFDVEADWP